MCASPPSPDRRTSCRQTCGSRRLPPVRPDFRRWSAQLRVVSCLATLGYDDATKRMKLLALHPGVTVQQVVDNTGFELIIPSTVEQNAPPTEQELSVLRSEVDPDHLYI